jgi:hypothetical protein
MDNFKSFFADLLRWVLDVTWSGIALFGGLIAIATALYPYFRGEPINWYEIGGVVLLTFVASAFQAWREDRELLRTLQCQMDALNVPDLNSTQINYVWIGRAGDATGVFLHLVIINLGAPSAIGRWHVTATLSDREENGDLANLPRELYGNAILRMLKNIELISGQLRRGGPIGAMIWATFPGLEPKDINPAKLTVSFVDGDLREYRIVPSAWVVKRANKERGSSRPYESDDSIQRLIEKAQRGPLYDWRRS